MRKLKVAIAALIIMPLMIVSAQIYLDRASKELVDIINAAENSAKAGNIEESNAKIDDFLSEWYKNKRIFATFIRHAELDIANQSAAKLKPYLENEDKSNFYGECETIKMQIKHIAETEKFSAVNIF